MSKDKLDEIEEALEGVDVEKLIACSSTDAPLVDRLKAPPQIYSPLDLRLEAAARIEALEAENKRLRDALEVVAHVKPMSQVVSPSHRLIEVQDIARAALQQSKETSGD